MKLGKKVLSCILAIMMIVTSISVCFTVLGSGETQLKVLENAIVSDYDGLKDAIDSKDSKRVPTLSENGINQWVVGVDTYKGGWLNVANAYQSYAKAVAGNLSGKFTFADIYNEALASIAQDINNGSYPIPYKDVQAILEVFKFGREETGNYAQPGVRGTLVINTGYDILHWDTIEEIEENRVYANCELRFTTSALTGGNYGLSSSSNVVYTQQNVSDPEDNNNVNVLAIKEALRDCVREDAFKTWFKLDLASMSVDEIMALVQGEKSCANILGAFTLVAELSNSATPEQLWDHYVAKSVGKTYAETQDWINNGLLQAITHAYAVDYKRQLDEKMAVDYAAFTANGNKTKAAQILDHYNSVVAIDQALRNQTNYLNENIFDDINAVYKSEFEDYYDTTVTAYLAKLKADVAREYAIELADELNALVAEEVPTYDHNDSAAAEAWQGSAEEAQAKDFMNRATVLMTKIDGFVLGYGTFDDVKNSFSANGNRVSEDLYNKLKDKMDTTRIDVDGYQHFAVKAKMDTAVKLVIVCAV